MNLRCFKIHLTYSCRSIFLELTFKRLYLSVESGLFLKPHTFSPDSCEWDLKLLWRERCQNNAFSVTVFSGFVQPIRVKKVAGFKKISRFLRKSLYYAHDLQKTWSYAVLGSVHMELGGPQVGVACEQALWRRGWKRKESLQLRLWNLNICTEKSRCEMLIGGDDISNDVITLGTCF